MVDKCIVLVEKGDCKRLKQYSQPGCTCALLQMLVVSHDHPMQRVQINHLVLGYQVETLKHSEKMTNRRSQNALQVRIYCLRSDVVLVLDPRPITISHEDRAMTTLGQNLVLLCFKTSTLDA